MNSTRNILIALGLSFPLAAHADLTTNLVAYWDFESNATNNAAASGGSAYDGTLMGNAAIIGGVAKAGTGSLVLDGADDYLDVTTIVDVNLPWTASAWYRLDSAPAGTARMMVFETSGNAFAISFGLREDGILANTNHQTVVDTSPTTDPVGNASVADNVTALTWNHVALAFTPATPIAAGSVVVYLNGVVSNNLIIPAASTLAIPNAGFHIGTYRSADSRWFDGSIDEVAVWNRTLTVTDVAELHQRGQASLSLTADLSAAGKAFVSVETSSAVMGQTFGTGLYDLNSLIQIEAVPNTGHVFTDWSAPFSAQPALFNQMVTSSVSLTATFAQDTADNDNDGLNNYQELLVYFTQPDDEDTDDDLINDGDEVEESLTNPLVSQLIAVNYIVANLGGGGVNPGDIVLTRSAETNTVSFLLSPRGSTTLADPWNPISSADPGVTLGVVAGKLELAIPGSLDHRKFFQFLGTAP